MVLLIRGKSVRHTNDDDDVDDDVVVKGIRKAKDAVTNVATSSMSMSCFLLYGAGIIRSPIYVLSPVRV